MYSIDDLLTNEEAFNETLAKMNSHIDRKRASGDSMNEGLENAEELGDLLDKVGKGDQADYARFCDSGNEDY